ncbi:MAG TPA: YMGG-like glycine zipper-containing protein [Chitinophagaceae bacterium]|nr:YMGG-like glycine zipper-containing protein [Chitinophagaceae bacterium]
MPDTSMYHNYPADAHNASSAHMATTYPTTHYSTRKTSVSHHRSYTSRSSYQAQSTTVKKKGWSSAAKGTAIGAGAGAVLGAVVAGDHNRVKGAVIGGVAGAAGGYLYGRHRDKKHKRY